MLERLPRGLFGAVVISLAWAGCFVGVAVGAVRRTAPRWVHPLDQEAS